MTNNMCVKQYVGSTHTALAVNLVICFGYAMPWESKITSRSFPWVAWHLRHRANSRGLASSQKRPEAAVPPSPRPQRMSFPKLSPAGDQGLGLRGMSKPGQMETTNSLPGPGRQDVTGDGSLCQPFCFPITGRPQE